MYISLGLFAGLAAARCFDLTLSFPPPRLDSSDHMLAETFESVHNTLLTAVKQTKYENVSFAIAVTSSKETLWSAEYTSPANKASKQGVAVVDDKTLFRIASITKTFTVLGILYQHAAGNLSLDDSVLKNLPELNQSASTHLAWKDITIRALASQLSGIFRDTTFEDLYNHPSSAAKLGLPPNIPPTGLPTCGEFSNLQNPCNASDLYASFIGRSGPYAPNQKSTYSNDAFSILGLVLAAVTHTSYSTYIQSAIFTPLNMSHTTLTPPPFSLGIIPPGKTWYGIEEGTNRPTGGIYSCSADMAAYLRYVLTHYNGLTHGAANWFHPQSYAEGANSFYGMPWEIFRSEKVLPLSRRPVTFVTKGGSVPGYDSQIVMSAEHDVGVVILVAGNPEFVAEARELVTVPLVRAADQVALAQLARYEGTYVPHHDTKSAEALNTTITLRRTRGSGLRIVQFISNGTDVLAGAEELVGMRAASMLWQLTPTLLFRDFERQAGEVWRAVPVSELYGGGGEGGVWDDFCLTNVEIQDYAGVPFNELVFWMDGERGVEELELAGYRIKLRKGADEDFLGVYEELAIDL